VKFGIDSFIISRGLVKFDDRILTK